MLVAASEGEVCVCNFVEPLGESQSTISYHLRILGVFVGSLVPTERPIDDVVADEFNHASRARAYEAFGESVAESWLTGTFLFTFQPQLLGYLHGFLGLMRAQKRFEEQTSLEIACLSNVLLYASSDMQEASAALLRGGRATVWARGRRYGDIADSAQMAQVPPNRPPEHRFASYGMDRPASPSISAKKRRTGPTTRRGWVTGVR